MSTETIALLTILRDETQSRDVHARCQAAIADLEWTEPKTEAERATGRKLVAIVRGSNAKAWDTTVAGRFADAQIIRGGEEVRIK